MPYKYIYTILTLWYDILLLAHRVVIEDSGEVGGRGQVETGGWGEGRREARRVVDRCSTDIYVSIMSREKLRTA